MNKFISKYDYFNVIVTFYADKELSEEQWNEFKKSTYEYNYTPPNEIMTLNTWYGDSCSFNVPMNDEEFYRSIYDDPLTAADGLLQDFLLEKRRFPSYLIGIKIDIYHGNTENKIATAITSELSDRMRNENTPWVSNYKLKSFNEPRLFSNIVSKLTKNFDESDNAFKELIKLFKDHGFNEYDSITLSEFVCHAINFNQLMYEVIPDSKGYKDIAAKIDNSALSKAVEKLENDKNPFTKYYKLIDKR